MEDLRDLLTPSRRFTDRSDCEWIAIGMAGRYNFSYVSMSSYNDCEFKYFHDITKHFNRNLEDSDGFSGFDIMKITNSVGDIIWEREEN